MAPVLGTVGHQLSVQEGNTEVLDGAVDQKDEAADAPAIEVNASQDQ